ncbi:MAG: acetamidase/formamidase family protein [Vicinamibacterales bacterium]
MIASCMMAPTSAETHRFKATQFYITYSSAHPPALRIKPGDRVITQTIDAEGRDAADVKVAATPNPQIGPFFIEGAEPGDTLVVTLDRVETNRTTARMGGLLAPYALDPAFLRSRAERQAERETWIIDKQKGVARTTTAGMKPGPIELPIATMLGCVATAPRNNEAFSATTPGRFGGNMDYVGVTTGAKLMLPVSAPGALLFLGDGHARMGEGEVVGTGLETSMDVEFTVDLIKGKAIGWPRLENADYIMVLGSARPLLEALQHADTEMLTWLMNDYGFDERSASILMGQALEIDTANIVDPNFTVVVKIKKQYLPRR